MNKSSQATINTMSSMSCINVSFNSNTDSISLTNAYPMTTTEGLTTMPYDFTITNTCNNYVEYYILASVISTTPQLDSSFVKVELDGNINLTPKILTTLESYPTPESLSSFTILNNYKLGGLVLNSSESNTFNFRMWLDGDQSEAWTSEEIENKSFTIKLSVVGAVKTNPTTSGI